MPSKKIYFKGSESLLSTALTVNAFAGEIAICTKTAVFFHVGLEFFKQYLTWYSLSKRVLLGGKTTSLK